MAKIDPSKQSGKWSKVSEKSGNFENDIEWQPWTYQESVRNWKLFFLFLNQILFEEAIWSGWEFIVFHSNWKYMLTTGMLQVNRIKIRECSRGAMIRLKAYCHILRYGKPVLQYILRYTWYLYFCLLLPLVQYYNIIQGSWNWHLLQSTHCHIFSYSFCPLAAFQGEMIEFVSSLLDISLQ